MKPIEPANAADIQKVVTERIAAAQALKGTQETVTIEWRGASLPITVIKMPVDLLYYNPLTHRVRAQRSLDPVKDKDLDDNPFGSPAQAYLHHLLMGDPSDPSKVDPTFEALKEDLRAHGQNEPGIITMSGVLINANTRRAALKELGLQHIRVGVLPSDASAEDILAVELSLQLRKEYKRDYSFMNSLLAIEERVLAGMPAADVMRAFRIRQATFDRNRWILAFVQDVIRRSETTLSNGTSVGLRLVDFESDQGKLEELYRTYSTLKSAKPDDAEALKEQRLIALVFNKSKTDLRLIEPDFAGKFMPNLLKPGGGTPSASPAKKIPGTRIEARKPSQDVSALRETADRILKARAVVKHSASAALGAADLTAAQQLITEHGDALESALEKAGKNARVTKKKLAAADRLSDAVEDLELCYQAIADARASGAFDVEDLADTLLELRAALVKIARLVGSDALKNVDGLKWLGGAVKLGADGS